LRKHKLHLSQYESAIKEGKDLTKSNNLVYLKKSKLKGLYDKLNEKGKFFIQLIGSPASGKSFLSN